MTKDGSKNWLGMLVAGAAIGTMAVAAVAVLGRSETPQRRSAEAETTAEAGASSAPPLRYSERSAADGADAGTPIQAGKQDLTVHVTVTYLLG